jgi:hypothetical protein
MLLADLQAGRHLAGRVENLGRPQAGGQLPALGSGSTANTFWIPSRVHICTASRPIAPSPWTLTASPELDLGVVDGLQGDRGQADEQGPLGRLAGREPHQRVGGLRGGGQVQHRLLLVRGAGVDQVAHLDLGDVGGNLDHVGDHLVAEGHRIAGGAAGVW